MVGIRVLDVGALILWLIWFARQRSEDDDVEADDPPAAGDPSPQWPAPSPGDRIESAPWPYRRRDHGGDRVPVARPRRPRRSRPRVPTRS